MPRRHLEEAPSPSCLSLTPTGGPSSRFPNSLRQGWLIGQLGRWLGGMAQSHPGASPEIQMGGTTCTEKGVIRRFCGLPGHHGQRRTAGEPTPMRKDFVHVLVSTLAQLTSFSHRSLTQQIFHGGTRICQTQKEAVKASGDGIPYEEKKPRTPWTFDISRSHVPLQSQSLDLRGRAQHGFSKCC